MIEFYSYNFVDFAEITADSENALFPASNLIDNRRTKVFRSTTSDANIIFDLKSIEAIDSLCIVDNPLTGWGVNTITVEANATADFTSPAFTTTLTFSQEHGIGIKELDTAQSYRFWRFVCTGSSYVELSKVFIGKKIGYSPKSPNFNWRYTESDQSKSQRNRYGQIFTDKTISKKNIRLDLALNNRSDMDKLFEMFDYVGLNKPFFVRIGDGSGSCLLNDDNRFSSYMRLQRDPEFTNVFYRLYNTSLTMEEYI